MPDVRHMTTTDASTLRLKLDEEGRTAGRIGYQPDGGIGLVPDPGIGEPPARPSTPQVAGGPVGVIVVWDGRLVDDDGDLPLPSTFDHVSVHVHPGDVPGFEPTAATFVGTIPRAGGAFPVTPLPVGEVHTVRLVAVTTSGVEGAPSAPATGTPEAVGGVPEPGSITEVELADDAVTTPKLRAEAVQAWHIVAQAIETGHLAAQAVTAAKLAAEIVLASRLIAGNPAADRVEIDGDGLRGYDDQNTLIFAIQDGSAVFTGDITGSEITGSRFTMGTAPVTGTIEADGSSVFQRVQSGTRQAQLAANASQANFLALSDATTTNGPLAGFSATASQVQFVLDSSADPGDGLPAVTGVASSNSAELTTWAERNNVNAPYSIIGAQAGQAVTIWHAPGAGQVRVAADGSSSSIRMAGPSAAPGTAKWALILGATGTDSSRALSIRSPQQDADSLWSGYTAESAGPSRPHTRVTYYADEHRIRPGVDGSTIRPSGTVRLDPTVRMYAPAHAPLRTDMASAPSSGPSGNWNAFSAADFPPISFTTGPSGRARITITAAAGNTNTSTATIHFGFGLTGGSTINPAVARAWSARGVLMQCCSRVVHLDLEPSAAYTLTPHWNYSSGTIGTHVTFYTTFEHSIVVEPLM